MRKRSKLTKKYYNDPIDHNKCLMVNAVNECTRLIKTHKERNLIRMSVNLEDPSTAPKTNWSILNNFLRNEKIPIMQPLPVNGRVAKILQIFPRIPNFLIHILLLNVLQ